MNRKLASLISGIVILSSIASACAEQVPGAVLAVETNPLYFSEGGIGIGILKFFERPLTPYIVPGKTTEQSSAKEIYAAYIENTKNTAQKPIVDDKDRATVFVTEFSNGELKTPLVFNTFTKFTHIAKDTSENTPYYYQTISYGLELESLPSTDKKPFYDLLVQPSINPGKKPEPFDVIIKLLTGDGNTLQTWKYQDCTINSYTPYLDENLSKIKFVGAFVSEIRDKTSFSCQGFQEDFVPKETIQKSETILAPVLPDLENRVSRVLVQFSGGEFTKTSQFNSFSKFVPLTKDPNSGLPISIPGNVIGDKPRFLLESLPTKDKEEYYKQISRYINPGSVPQPFDVTVHLITNNNSTLQIWKYADCSANNYSVFFIDNLFFYKFKQAFGSEIREKTFFDCNGLEFNPANTDPVNTDDVFVPNSYIRAQVFSIHFEGPDISPAKTLTSFTKFSPITQEEMALLLPNSPFGDSPKFYLSSLPSKDNDWYYQLMSRYINSGSIPEPFDVTVDVILGDATKLQSWKYSDCQVLEFKPFLEDALFLRKFTNQFEPEIRDRTIFQCTGLEFDGNSVSPEKTPEKSLDYVDFIPSTDDRVKNVIATFSGGELSKPFIMYTVGKFQPKVEQRSQTETQFVKLSVTIVPNIEAGGQLLRGPPEYCGPDQNPPGCRPCPPNNSNCSDESTDPPTDPPTEPAEPGINPPYTVLVTKPHLSVMQRNDYIKSTEFTLTTLPSKDKMKYYDIVSRYINPGKKPEPFDIQFDYVTGNGTVLQSWKYADCQLKDFRIELRDNLLYFAMSGLKGATDIVDSSTFQCNGFSMDAQQHKSDYDESIPTTPSSYDRAMLNLIHWYGGELSTQRSLSLVQEYNSLPGSDLFLGGLPNIYHKDVYDFINRYVNLGKKPEPFDMRVDTLTGDGTVLFSTIYADCTIKDAATYLIDTMAIIRYVPGLKSEIRGQSIVDCVGANFKTLPQNDPLFDINGNMKKISPFLQTAIGVPSEGVTCNDGFDLMIRPPKNVPICVQSDHTSELEKRGWMHESETNKKLIDMVRPLLPTEAERATSFTVNFEGSDITPQQTVKTFSKFIPIADENAIIQTPSNPLNPSKVAFYLESLSSKDKSWYYEFASRYVNPGAKPEKFNVSVQVNSGNGNVLQNWKYRECTIDDFTTYYDDALLKWKFHDKWQSEFKDKSVFSCTGLSIDS